VGGFYGSTHIRMDSNQPVKQVLSELAVKERFKCYLAPPINGWVAIYNDGHGQVLIGDILANYFPQDILTVLVHDDDVFCYWYFKDGKLLDHYNSCPEYFGEKLSKKKLEKCKAHPEVFKDILADPKQFSSLQRVLNPEKKEYTVNLPQDVMQQQVKFAALSKAVQEFANNPAAIMKFLNEQNLPPNEKLKEFMLPLVKQGKTEEEIRDEVAKHPELMTSFITTLLTRFVEQKQKDLDQHPPQKLPNKVESYMGSEFLFASEQMVQFTDLFGIKNTITSYEYIEQGETENIERFSDFIKIPE